MSLNTYTIAAVREELCSRIMGSKIDKVQQPQRDIIIFTLRGRTGDINKLLISLTAGSVRIHLTEHTFENPATPPMFCMLLRKHLSGARIEAIVQPPSERILEFTLKTSDLLGDMSEKRLIVELFGRIPNIILADRDDIIIDCLRRIGGDVVRSGALTTGRMLLPGLKYHAPVPVESKPQSQMLPANISESMGTEMPHISISGVLDATYTRRAVNESMHRRSLELSKTMRTAQKRIERRLAAQRAELDETAHRDYLRQCGDIIMANLRNIRKGDDMLAADDFYSKDGQKRMIKLDPLLTPQRNAAKYYKDYTKARNAVVHLSKQIAIGETELEYIGSVIEQLSKVESEQELDEIRGELLQTKYIKQKSKKVKQTKKASLPKIMPAQFRSSSGLQIFAGKNNSQNDILTFKTASKTDIWLHTQKIHGSHVIIKHNDKPVDDTTLREAAVIAAYYSSARNAGKVPVDYTLVKNIKKRAGARPGMVIYTDYKTIIAKPDEEMVMQLKI